LSWIEWMKELSAEDVLSWLDYISAYGPLPGIALTFVEALLPFLPLVVILVANANAYGMWQGFLLSWIGTTVGALVVFLFFRLLGRRFSAILQRRYPKTQAMFRWLHHRGFTPLLIAYSLPFTPSALVNAISGISTIPIRTYLLALALGKGLLVLIITFLGQDLGSLIRTPWKIVFILILFYIMWWLGKKWEARYHNDWDKHEERPSA